MLELLFVGGLAAVVVAIVLATFAALAFVFRALLWIVLLPIKLALALIIGVVAFPILAIGAVIALVGVVLAVAIPLLPFLLVAALVWVLVKAAKPALA